ncbi:MAG: GIY-YIG nuclease family protein [Trueperaceae bacterium]|nr:GIY-YIG nuclease family protein [Trueperaceae bacterium]
MTTSSPRPTSIRIFLADGVPDGLRIVEKSNWTGRAVVASRSQLDRALVRDELGQPGVYVLTGPGEAATPQVYVGEADVLRERIKQHVASKEFWTRLVAFTSTNEGLNKAHVRYLESRLVGLARDANQWKVANGTQPASPPLSEADRADAEWFLEEMMLIFPVLGIDAFSAAASQARAPGPDTTDDSAELRLAERGAEAKGTEVAEGFVVMKGARARTSETKSIHNYLRELRAELQDRDVLVTDGDSLLFAQDYRFTSPSTAAGVLVGGNANGRRAWKDARGRTLKELQQARAESPE